MTDAAGGLTEYTYDPNGNRTTVWDPQHSRAGGTAGTQYTYDTLTRSRPPRTHWGTP